MTTATATAEAGLGQLQRAIDWKGAFCVASSVPPLVLFSIGGIAAAIGAPSWPVCALSI